MAKINKIPCIKCDSKLWEYIKPYLEKWRYTFEHITETNWKNYPVLVINIASDLGICGNIDTYSECYDRELTNNVEKFLEQAAKLKGFIYERKDVIKIHGIEIKPGIVLRGITINNKEIKVVTFPMEGETLGFADITRGGWSTNYKSLISEMLEIKDLSKGGYYIDSGDTLWKKSKKLY